MYLYKNAEGEVIYVGKAKNLRSRVASYFHEGRWVDAKTGTLVREAVDVDYVVVANNKEALALENHFIKQRKPRFNILLRDDKTYPYVKLTLGERFPRVYVTRRLRKDGTRVDVSVTVSPILDSSGPAVGASAIARDISEGKRAEQARQDSEERFRTLADNIAQCAFPIAACAASKCGLSAAVSGDAV